MCLGTKSKNATTTEQQIKHKNPCRSRELKPGPLAHKADALPQHHRGTEATEGIPGSKAFKVFRRNGSKRK